MKQIKISQNLKIISFHNVTIITFSSMLNSLGLRKTVVLNPV